MILFCPNRNEIQLKEKIERKLKQKNQKTKN